MCKQILPISSLRNIWGTVRRTCMLILGLKGLAGAKHRKARLRDDAFGFAKKAGAICHSTFIVKSSSS